MIDTKAIRSKILDLAMRGKLTEQLPEDGTAEELYQQIQKEKQALIKSGKIKKEKPLPEIAEDEIPFEIPNNWKWVRFAEISSIINGDRGKNYPAKSSLKHEGIPFISALNLNGITVTIDENLLCVDPHQYDLLRSGKLQKGDIVICIRGSLGKHGRYPFDKGAIASSLVISRLFYQSKVLGDYKMNWLDSSAFPYEIERYNSGTAQPNLAANSLKKFLFPLPPLTEQKRSVEKIEQTFSVLDIIDKLQAQYADNLTVLKSKLIDLAIQGKLTEQLPEDGTAEELYQEIQAEKQSLIKSGKIKKEKPLPEIAEAEILFEIPNNWKWVRLNSICYSIFAGGDKPEDFVKGKDEVHKIPVVANGISNEGIMGYTALATAPSNTLTVAGRGTIGFPCCRNYEYCPVVRLIVINQSNYIDLQYLYYVFLGLPVDSVGSSIPQLTVPMVMPKLIPLPPLAEQKRIVDCLDKILAMCDEMR